MGLVKKTIFNHEKKDNELQTIQKTDLNDLIYALDVGDSGPVCVSQSAGLVLLSRGDITQKLRTIENYSNPFTCVIIGKVFKIFYLLIFNIIVMY